MEPEYIKSILKPLGMLTNPIIFISDHQRPEILEKLLADEDIGPNIYVFPENGRAKWVDPGHAQLPPSWLGGDMTAAIMSMYLLAIQRPHCQDLLPSHDIHWDSKTRIYSEQRIERVNGMTHLLNEIYLT